MRSRFMSIAHHLVRFQCRIETIAESHSVPGKTDLDLEDTLRALTLTGRRRVIMMLEMAKAFSEDPQEKAAAEHIRMRAARVWDGTMAFGSHVGDRAHPQ
jgi:hypothetical protein